MLSSLSEIPGSKGAIITPAYDKMYRKTYNGYYPNPTIFQVIGYPERLAQGTSGSLDLLDESLLEQQRQRAPFWRRS